MKRFKHQTNQKRVISKDLNTKTFYSHGKYYFYTSENRLFYTKNTKNPIVG